jgi:hypothetical protein
MRCRWQLRTLSAVAWVNVWAIVHTAVIRLQLYDLEGGYEMNDGAAGA